MILKNTVFGGEFGADAGVADEVSYTGSETAVTVEWNSTDGRYEATTTQADELNGIEIIEGSNLGDQLTGYKSGIIANSGVDSFRGGAGNDTISGGAGDDYLEGGTGVDTVYDHIGSDTLYGGAGAGSGEAGDTIDFSGITNTHNLEIDIGTQSAVEVQVSDGGNITNTIDGFNVVIASGGDDTIKGSDSLLLADTLFGGEGDDTIVATLGGDNIVGGDHTLVDDTQGSGAAKVGSGDWLSFEDVSGGAGVTVTR